ncbi:MAG: glycosyltransferase [Jatrophihabitans sp.]|uniref:glycosyltransferase n=1 Tax=Jatrophihabitans sp. TaxID=1932789 RepID=UPI003F8028CE
MTVEAAGPGADTTGTGGRALRTLARVVLPGNADLDVVPLYVETKIERGASAAAAEESGHGETAEDEGGVRHAAAVEQQSEVQYGVGARGMGDIAGRRSAEIHAGSRVSFGTYFNAFPAGYWRRWTVLEEVVLRAQLTGTGTLVVYRSTASGHSYPVESLPIDGPTDIELALPLDKFVDGGWYWFDVAAGRTGATLVQAEWAARTDRLTPGRLSIGITTFNRTEMCVRGLAVLAQSPDLLEVLDHIYVVDQGTQKVSEHPDYAMATKPFEDRLRLIEQGNLGGSGGFARAMDETVQAGRSDYVLLLDDDVETEPESMLRAIAFADHARRPTIVGGHMFSLYNRSVLHAFGEWVQPYNWWWGAAPYTRTQHDFGRRNLRNTAWLHQRIDVDYNGWWMCMIPTAAVRELGLSLPVFIKWDDAEYGLRAKEAGVPTVSLPGMAVWHVPWQDKNDALDWQAYYHLRNRLVAALLHSPYPRGGSVVTENLEFQFRHVLSMQYSTAEMRLMAIEDVLSGPDHLHRDLPRKLGELRTLRKRYDDATTQVDQEHFPRVVRKKPPKRGREPEPPKNPVSLVVKAAIAAVKQLRPVEPADLEHPQAIVPSQRAEWWVLAGLDGALVSSADGTGTAWYKRDPRQFRELMKRSSALHSRLLREWPQLAEQYRAAAGEFTSPERWRETFRASTS